MLIMGVVFMDKSEFEYLLSIGDKLSEYVDRWIAIVGEEVVAVGDSAREVFEAAKRKYPDREPMIVKLPSERVMLL